MKRTTLILTVIALITACSVSFAFADEPAHKYKTFYQRGLELYEYVLQPVPVALGYPKLSDDEIDELIASNDYRLVQEKISTVADCINYFTRAGFSEDVKSTVSYNWCTHTSGAQTLMRRGGECGGMANCLAYLLKGDYDNLYYVHVSAHAMVVIEQDDMFYLVNPVELQNPKKEKKNTWCDIWADRTICFAESIQELADSHYNSGTTEQFFIQDTGGDMLPAGLEEIDGESVPCFPTGTEKYVTVYYGEEYQYAEPDFTAPNAKYDFFIKMDCPDFITGEYFIPEELLGREETQREEIDFTIVDSSGNPQDNVYLSMTEQEAVYSVEFYGAAVDDYTVEVSDENKAGVKKLEEGRFALTAETSEPFYLTVKYRGVNASFECGSLSEPKSNSQTDKESFEIRLLGTKKDHREKTPLDTLQLKTWKKTVYSVLYSGDTVKNYTVMVSDENKVRIKKLANGQFAVTALSSEPFTVTVCCEDDSAAFQCESSFGVQSLWGWLINSIASIF